MKKSKPVSISKNAFAFCRYSVTILIWLAFIFKLKELLVLVWLILLLSAIFKVKKAPMILLYTYTLNKIFPSSEEIINEHAMRFAHTLGSVFSFICVLLLYFGNENWAWKIVFVFAIIKSISAFGFCPASKLYECATGKNCCCYFNPKK